MTDDSMLETLSRQLGSGGIDQISNQLGIGRDQTERAVAGALPMLLGGLMRNSQSTDGAAALLGALQKDHDGSVLDDIGGFLPDYLDQKILPVDPFQVLDRDSVGVLVKMGIEKGRSTRPDLKVGICGEHGGDPNSVEFCHLVGMNYVSCSPYRVPIARLAAAHAQINFPRD